MPVDFLTPPRDRADTFAEPGDGTGLAQMIGDEASAFSAAIDNPKVSEAQLRLLQASERETRLAHNAFSEQRALEESYDRRIASVREATGVVLENPMRSGYQIEARKAIRDEMRADGGVQSAEDPGILAAQTKIFDQKIAAIAEQNPEAARDFMVDPAASARAIARSAADELETARADLANAGGSTTGRLATEFAGSVYGMRRDPLFVVSMFAGPAGAAGETALARVASSGLKQGLYNMGLTLAEQPGVQKWRGEIGLKSGVQPAMEETALAFLFGAIPGASIQGVKELAKPARAAIERLLGGTAKAGDAEAAHAAIGAPLDQTQTRAIHAGEISAQADAAADVRPPGLDKEGTPQAVRHGEDPANEPPAELELALPARPADQVRVLDESAGAGAHETVQGKPVTFLRFDPKDLGTDAATFQYKGNSDAAGVTDRLRHVTQWDPTASGKTFVFEREDGTRVIADGHQRLGLAKRLTAEQPDASIKLDGFLFREKDGWDVADVRALAAKKNMQEGSGDALDAAKILRDRPDILDGSLPVTGPVMKNAIALARLSDDAFGMALNGVVPPNHAAAVGAMVADPLQHGAVMADLARFQPGTEREARILIGEVMAAGFTAEHQINLFGAAEATRSLIAERVKTLDAALQALSKDKKLFGTLAEKADAIESAGNRLARDTNERRATDAAVLGDLVTKLAQRTGPVADALNRAAAQVAEGAKPAAAAQTFLDELRGLLDRDGLPALLAAPELKPAKAVEPGTAEALTAAGDRPAELSGGAEAAPGARPESRQGHAELKAMIATGAPIEQLEAHPIVQEAVDHIKQAPATGTLAQFEDPAFRAARVFDVGGQAVQGFDAAIAHLVEGAKAFAGGQVKHEKSATIVIGPPASGKSMVSEPIARARHAAIVDADEAKKIIPEFAAGAGTQATHEESSVLARGVLAELISEDANIVLPKVGADADGIRALAQKLKEIGYSVDLVHVSATPELSRARNINRFLDTGRLVLPEYLAQVGDKPSKAYYILKGEGHFHETADLDTATFGQVNVREGSGPIADSFRTGKDPGSRVVEGDRGRRGEAQQQTEVTAAGEQSLLPGVAPVSERDRLQLQAEKPLRGGEQAPAAGGLFDEGARKQVDLLDAIAVSERSDGAGARFISREAALEEADKSAFHADLVKACKD
jgi:hypothetical protein